MEFSSWPEHLHSHCKRAIQELIQGLEFTSQLQMRVCKPNDGSSMDDLVLKIKGSITESLSILSFCDSGEVSQIPASVHVGSPSWDGRKSEDSGESSKNSAFKDRRGSYKRRKTSKTCERVTSTLIDDGHAWRKYGQKMILNAKHPRNYYRCTHKFEQGCQATKQVQKSEDHDPPMYRITYHGHHTCRNLHKAPQIIFDSTTSTRDSSSILLTFESKGILEKKPDDLYFPMIKHEYNYKEDLQCLNNLHSSSPDYLMSPDLTTTFDSSELMSSMLSSRSDVISSGVSSCTTSSRSFDMDMMVANVNFDDIQFEF